MTGLTTHKHATWILAFISCIESSFFPIPPDVLLIPMVLKDRARALWLGFITGISSVIGGVIGYAIGYWALQAAMPILEFYNLLPALEKFQDSFQEYGALIIILKGLTPIPFKLVTLASGMAGMNFWLFLLVIFITRMPRFMLQAIVLQYVGERYKDFFDKHMPKILAIVMVIVILGMAVVFIPM